MCFAYLKMNELEKRPKKYMLKNCEFLLERGYSLEVFSINAEYLFDFKKGDLHIFFEWENEYVSCSLNKERSPRFVNVNITEITGDLPQSFALMTNIEKMNYLIALVKENIVKIEDFTK